MLRSPCRLDTGRTQAFRALQIRVTGPEIRDALASVAALGASLALYQHANQFPLVPFVIYWTLGILVVGSLYDLARFGFPRHWLATLWLYEHLVKILAAYAGVVQASTGMLFGSGQPYGRGQLIAAVLGIGVIVGYLIYFRTDEGRRHASQSEWNESQLKRPNTRIWTPPSIENTSPFALTT